MTQAALPVDQLWARLAAVFSDAPRQRVMRPGTPHPGGTFLRGMRDVFVLMVHEIDGWPSRNKVERWVEGYTDDVPPPDGHSDGTGPQAVVWSDGTVMQIVDWPLVTWHSEFLKFRSLGTETGHGGDARYEGGTATDPPPDIAPDTTPAGQRRQGWEPLSSQPEDLPGAKLFVRLQSSGDPPEVLMCWWTATTFTQAAAPNLSYLIPTREAPATVSANAYAGHPFGPPPAPTLMMFSEAEYRSWSLLARYQCEAFLVPRNLPLWPHALRSGNERPPASGASPPLRTIILADQNFHAIVRDLAPLQFDEPLFAPANLTAFRDTYDRARRGAHAPDVNEPDFQVVHNNKPLNYAWLKLFRSYRGVVGHGFAGSAIKGDHDCPGPMFDWHRFARELWDWWWYPFDFDPAFTQTSVAQRGYWNADRDTPVIEYFFENTPTDGRPDPYLARSAPPVSPGGFLGAASSPSSFALEPGSPVYAMANGELVAARLAPAGAGASLSFALVRHEVFHVADPTGLPGRIDYNVAPSTVFSLYMHLGQIDQMSFDEPTTWNPGWLNRMLVRYKECTLAYDSAGVLHPKLSAIAAAGFSQPPPAAQHRPNLLEALKLDRSRYGSFLDRLRAGEVATAPVRAPWDGFGPTPIKVLLGDFLGTAGAMRVAGGAATTGIRVEVFSPSLVAPQVFTPVTGQPGWGVPAGVAHPAVRYVSEWARALSPSEAAAATASGIDAGKALWWPLVAGAWDVGQQGDAVLPGDGLLYHYWPLDFMRWLNGVTWRSEWPKYREQDPTGAAMTTPPSAPRPRRVT